MPGLGRTPQPGPELPDPLSVLLYRVAKEEQHALGELYDLTVAKLFSRAGSIVRDSQDAEEVVCDVFVQVWHSARQFDRERGSALAWLLTLCRSRALDRYRRNHAGLPTVAQIAAVDANDSRGPGPDDLLQVLERDTAIYRALARLSPLRRRLIALAFFQGLTHEELADETHLPIGTVKSHIRRALASLRAELDRREGG